jgi:hypothetical protein
MEVSIFNLFTVWGSLRLTYAELAKTLNPFFVVWGIAYGG